MLTGRSCALMILVALSLLGAGPQTAPSRTDQGSPQATVRSLFFARDAEDAAALRGIFYAANKEQANLADAFVEVIIESKHLSDAAKVRFAVAGESLAAAVMSKEQLAAIDGASVKQIDEHTRTLTLAGQGRPWTFHEIGGKWLLSIADYAHASDEELPRQTAILKAMTDVMRTVISQIQAGKYATAEAAQADINRRFNELMIQAAQTVPPTTNP